MHNSISDLVTVVIPVLNEEEAIERVIKRVMAEGYQNILVVDGFSVDETVFRARSAGVKVIFQEGKGKTGAIATAINNLETPYVLFMDGDCTYDPRDIINIVSVLGNADLVIGVRTNGRENIPLFNRLGNWFINFEFNTLIGAKLFDVCSGMYGLRTKFAKALNLTTSGFDVEVEIAAQAVKCGIVAQVPILYHDRVGQQKLQPVRHGFQIILTVVKLAWRNNFNGNLSPRLSSEYSVKSKFSMSNDRLSD